MKRIISALLSVLLLLSLSAACFADNVSDIDLSGLSYDELMALKDRINLAMWESEEWQEVTVPQGIWKVGEDIPAGHWSIAVVDGATYAYVTVGSVLDEAKKSVAWSSDDYYSENMTSPTSNYYNANEDISMIDVELKNGMYVEIASGNVIFTPYQGKAALGFK